MNPKTKPCGFSSVSLKQKKLLKNFKSFSKKEINYTNVKKAIDNNLIQDLNNQSFFKTREGDYPSLLYAALDNGDTELIELLIDQGIDVNAVEPGRKPFLQELIMSYNWKLWGNVSLARKIINAGADINMTVQYNSNILRGHIKSPLFSMCMITNNRRIAELLIKSGVNITPPCQGNSCYGCSPWKEAINLNMDTVLKLLIKNGVDVNSRICILSTFPLHMAVAKNNIEFVKDLLDAGADINAVDASQREPPLHLALAENQIEIVKLLLKNLMINVNIQNFVTKGTVLHVLSRRNMKCIDFILNANPDVNIVDKNNKLAIESFLLENPLAKEALVKVQHHLVKLKAAGFYLYDRNLADVSEEKFNRFYDKCCQEVDFMKKTTISSGSHFNFHDVLHLNERQLALRLESCAGEEISPSGFDTKFPLYAGMIEYKLGKAVRWVKLRKSLFTVIYNLFNNHLPSTIIEMIFKYFNVHELTKLQQCQEKINSTKNKKRN